MPTHDYNLANQSGASFRTDLNNVLSAIQSNNSNASSPTTTVAYQWWADTTANIFKIRNSGNNAWINLFTLSGGIDVDAASNFGNTVTFAGDVTFDGATAGRNIVFDQSADALTFADSAVASFGASGDFRIFHNGSDSILQDQGTGSLIVLSNLFHVKNAANNETLAKFTQDSGCELFFNNIAKAVTTTDGLDITGDCDISGQVQVGTVGTYLKDNQLRSNAAGDMFIDHATTGQDIKFRTSVNSALDTDSVKITSVGNIAFMSGRGIDFSATGGPNTGTGTTDSELFHDYEEGDYTPTFTVNSGSITLASDQNTLSYTKIGRLVFIYGQVKVSSVSSPSGILRAPLPFAQADQTQQAERTMGNVFVSNAAVNNIGDFATYPNGGVDSFFEIVSVTGNVLSRNGGDNMQADCFILAQFSYISS